MSSPASVRFFKTESIKPFSTISCFDWGLELVLLGYSIGFALLGLWGYSIGTAVLLGLCGYSVGERKWSICVTNRRCNSCTWSYLFLCCFLVFLYSFFCQGQGERTCQIYFRKHEENQHLSQKKIYTESLQKYFQQNMQQHMKLPFPLLFIFILIFFSSSEQGTRRCRIHLRKKEQNQHLFQIKIYRIIKDTFHYPDHSEIGSHRSI